MYEEAAAATAPAPYSGDGDFTQWLYDIETFFKQVRIRGDASQVLFACNHFTGSAHAKWRAQARCGKLLPDSTPWPEFKSHMSAVLDSANDGSISQGDLSVAEYTQRFLESRRVHKYVTGLNPNVAGYVLSKCPKSLQEALELAMKYEAMELFRDSNSFRDFVPVRLVSKSEGPSTLPGRGETLPGKPECKAEKPPTLPGKVANGETIGGKTGTGKSASGEITTTDKTGTTGKTQTTKGNAACGKTTTSNAASGKTTTNNAASGKSTTGNAACGKTPTGKVPTVETPTGNAANGETTSGKAAKGQGSAKAGNAAAGETVLLKAEVKKGKATWKATYDDIFDDEEMVAALAAANDATHLTSVSSATPGTCNGDEVVKLNNKGARRKRQQHMHCTGCNQSPCRSLSDVAGYPAAAGYPAFLFRAGKATKLAPDPLFTLFGSDFDEFSLPD